MATRRLSAGRAAEAAGTSSPYGTLAGSAGTSAEPVVLRPWTDKTGCCFAGDNLLEELSFSCYYHFDRRNQVLHLCSLMFIFFGFFCGLLMIPLPLPAAAAWVPVVPLAFMLVYCGYFVSLDVATGLLSAVLLAPSLAAATYFRASSVGLACAGMGDETRQLDAGFGGCTTYVIVAVATFLVVVTQLGGHIVFERRLPAFRLYEATVITPFFLVLNLQFWCGARLHVRDAVYGLAPKWRGTERRVF